MVLPVRARLFHFQLVIGEDAAGQFPACFGEGDDDDAPIVLVAFAPHEAALFQVVYECGTVSSVRAGLLQADLGLKLGHPTNA